MKKTKTLSAIHTVFWLIFFAPIFPLLLQAPSYAANPYEETQLFRKGAWTVSHTFDTTDGDMWCSATTLNRQNQQFSLTAYPNGQLTLFIFDDTWNIAKRPVRFLIDIDYSRWTIDGTGDEFAVSLTFADSDKAAEFVGEIMEGNAIAVYNADQRRLGTFSLSGSFAAISNLVECWRRISETDPFTSSDPFKGASDPF